ncbi:DUF488 domain-containing protein [Methylovulum psychrotolerans]|uniref:DUF488 domain-containing protein n=1 Tax=Methylovulum psychrotolerans TaxID=1704499 RepID=UPI001BFF98D0|nr:DUF488 domain-containing protein [Methylovulum psychrotolerans]MBT9100100.1 DUF488 domain-containing protein [Methylovulum psychrotolerans]
MSLKTPIVNVSQSHAPIYTIGYGKRTIDEFIGILLEYDIKFLIDVRSYPYSKYKPDFSRELLKITLKSSGIKYVFMGNTLGGRPEDGSCYTDDKVDYEKTKTKSFYKEGIARLKTAWEKQLTVALMCSEGKPHECHRTKLISETLCKLGISTLHIDEIGKIKTQDEVMSQIMSGQLSLIGFLPDVLTSRKKYFPNERNSRARRNSI